jgi:hypothetical protein
MVAVVVVVNMVPVATTVTMLLLVVILVVGTDATATDGITTASKGMVDILEMRVAVAMMHTNRVEAVEAVGGVWEDILASTPQLTEGEEASGGEIINFRKAIGRARILRECSKLFFSFLCLGLSEAQLAGAPI